MAASMSSTRCARGMERLHALARFIADSDVPQIWTLPKLTLVFSTSVVSALENVLVDSGDAPALSLPQDPPRKQQEFDIEQILIAPLGESNPKPYLLVRSDR